MMRECVIPGCQKPAKTRTWCKMHYTRWLRHGDAQAKKRPGPQNVPKRYAKVGKRYVHRVIWELIHGPIKRGYVVHHINNDRLDNRPENLALIKRQEHIRLHGIHNQYGGGCHV